MNNPLVSILIPVYNREKIISETINCAINQTYKNIEIIICDNCSTDNTWEILQEWEKKDSRIKIFRNKENVGPVLNWKECIDKATGEYSKILWSDDLISYTFIEHTLPLFDDETAFVLTKAYIFCSYDEIRGSNIYSINKPLYSINQSVYTKEQYLSNCLIKNTLMGSKFTMSPGNALFRTIDLKNSLLIDIPNNDNLDFKNYGAGNDLLIFLMIIKQYKKIKVVNNMESFFRSHGGSISISNSDTIPLYYEWVRYYYIENYYPILLGKYKAKLFLKVSQNKSYINIYKDIKTPPDILYIFKLYIEMVLINKIKKIISRIIPTKVKYYIKKHY